MIYNRDDEAIIAQCTPRGSAALALIRISGTNAFELAQTMIKLPGKQSLNDLQSHTIHFGYVHDAEGKNLDHVMVIAMRGPKTFTGQDVIEITCHGNQLIVEAIIARAIQVGARLAGAGEFSQRAFAHGKIDLLQAEAINDLINAQTQTALKKSLAQLEGTFSHWVQDIEQGLLKALAWCEASFEFLDEGAEFGYEIKLHIEDLMTTIATLKKTYAMQQQVRQGVRIALIGLVNAGKSSLFNALLQTRRAIVSDIPGTTRDTIEAGMTQQGNQWTLIDTAGIRKTDDIIEQEGIKRSREEAHKADIIVLVIDGSITCDNQELALYQELLSTYSTKTIIAYTKMDKAIACSACLSAPSMHISSINGQGIENMRNALADKANELLATHESPFLLNARHYNLILGLEKQLQIILPMLQNANIQYELISFHVRQALESLTELTGKSISEAAMNQVFKQFCVGK